MAYKTDRACHDVMAENSVNTQRSATGTIKTNTGSSHFYSKFGITLHNTSVEDSDHTLCHIGHKKTSSTSSISSKNIVVKKMTSLDDCGTKFPKLQECAHFHYEYVELAALQLVISNENQENTRIQEGSRSQQLYVQVTSRHITWTIRRTYENFRNLDKQLHRCIFDRRFSMLPELKQNEMSEKDFMAMKRLLQLYLARLSDIAGNMINCGPVLSWFELDNRGNQLIVSDDSEINTPAVAAAHVVKRYSARDRDEISLEVGDFISIIDMPPGEESMWWRGKKCFEVGFFPAEHVELIKEKLSPSMTSQLPQIKPKPVLKKHGKLISLLRNFFTSRPARTQLKRTGIVKERVFGCDLGEHLLNTAKEIPLVLECCTDTIEKHGIVDGIYRLSGVASNIQKLRNEFDEDGQPVLTEECYMQDIHSISSLLKAYFRDLPNPLFTFQLYDKFIAAIQDEGSKLERIHDVIQQLPPPHYRTAKYLMLHLLRVSRFGHQTGMHCKNLAIVWAPNLLRSKDLEQHACSSAALHSVGIQAIVTEYMIDQADFIFSDQLVNHSTADSGSLRPGRPKSLAISTPTKLLSLEEARAAVGPSAGSPTQRYIEVGGGPSTLPDKYHTIISLPSKKKSKKERKSPTGWRSIFTKRGQTLSVRDSERAGSTSSISSGVVAGDVDSDEYDALACRLRTVHSADSLLNDREQPYGQKQPDRFSDDITATYINIYTDGYGPKFSGSTSLPRMPNRDKESVGGTTDPPITTITHRQEFEEPQRSRACFVLETDVPAARPQSQVIIGSFDKDMTRLPVLTKRSKSTADPVYEPHGPTGLQASQLHTVSMDVVPVARSRGMSPGKRKKAKAPVPTTRAQPMPSPVKPSSQSLGDLVTIDLMESPSVRRKLLYSAPATSEIIEQSVGPSPDDITQYATTTLNKRESVFYDSEDENQFVFTTNENHQAKLDLAENSRSAHNFEDSSVMEKSLESMLRIDTELYYSSDDLSSCPGSSQKPWACRSFAEMLEDSSDSPQSGESQVSHSTGVISAKCSPQAISGSDDYATLMHDICQDSAHGSGTSSANTSPMSPRNVPRASYMSHETPPGYDTHSCQIGDGCAAGCIYGMADVMSSDIQLSEADVMSPDIQLSEADVMSSDIHLSEADVMSSDIQLSEADMMSSDIQLSEADVQYVNPHVEVDDDIAEVTRILNIHQPTLPDATSGLHLQSMVQHPGLLDTSPTSSQLSTQLDKMHNYGNNYRNIWDGYLADRSSSSSPTFAKDSLKSLNQSVTIMHMETKPVEESLKSCQIYTDQGDIVELHSNLGDSGRSSFDKLNISNEQDDIFCSTQEDGDSQVFSNMSVSPEYQPTSNVQELSSWTGRNKTENLAQRPVYSKENLIQPADYSTANCVENLAQPTAYSPENFMQPAAYSKGNLTQPSAYRTGNLRQTAAYSKENLAQPSAYSKENLTQPAAYSKENLKQPSACSTENFIRPPPTPSDKSVSELSRKQSVRELLSKFESSKQSGDSSDGQSNTPQHVTIDNSTSAQSLKSGLSSDSDYKEAPSHSAPKVFLKDNSTLKGIKLTRKPSMGISERIKSLHSGCSSSEENDFISHQNKVDHSLEPTFRSLKMNKHRQVEDVKAVRDKQNIQSIILPSDSSSSTLNKDTTDDELSQSLPPTGTQVSMLHKTVSPSSNTEQPRNPRYITSHPHTEGSTHNQDSHSLSNQYGSVPTNKPRSRTQPHTLGKGHVFAKYIQPTPMETAQSSGDGPLQVQGFDSANLQHKLLDSTLSDNNLDRIIASSVADNKTGLSMTMSYNAKLRTYETGEGLHASYGQYAIQTGVDVKAATLPRCGLDKESNLIRGGNTMDDHPISVRDLSRHFERQLSETSDLILPATSSSIYKATEDAANGNFSESKIHRDKENYSPWSSS